MILSAKKTDSFGTFFLFFKMYEKEVVWLLLQAFTVVLQIEHKYIGTVRVYHTYIFKEPTNMIKNR